MKCVIVFAALLAVSFALAEKDFKESVVIGVQEPLISEPKTVDVTFTKTEQVPVVKTFEKTETVVLKPSTESVLRKEEVSPVVETVVLQPSTESVLRKVEVSPVVETVQISEVKPRGRSLEITPFEVAKNVLKPAAFVPEVRSALVREPSPSVVPVVARSPAARAFVEPKPEFKRVEMKSVDDKNVEVLEEKNEMNPDGHYMFSGRLSNGIHYNQEGSVVSYDPETAGLAAKGDFGWTSNDGQIVDFTFVADKDGYHPKSDAIPTSPPVPKEIAAALKWVAEKLSQKEVTRVEGIRI